MTLKRAIQYIEAFKVPKTDRPYFHLTPPVGWLNDPNGFSIFNGEGHLFYQYHPYDTRWGPMYWGHAKSADLIRWEDLPPALAPEDSYDAKSCYSGSAIEKDGKSFLIYTGVSQIEENGKLVERQQQCLAIGDGVSYRKYDKNPIISYNALPDGFSKEHFRDPKVWKDGNHYYQVVGNLNAQGHAQILLFQSSNLIDWNYKGILAEDDTHTYGSMWECPDFFALGEKHVLICSPQYMKAKGLEFHNGHNSIYFVGKYKNEHFEKGLGRSLDYGFDFYAPQTTELPDGRRILIGWLKSWDSISSVDTIKWQGMMTLPRELTWDGERLIQQPISELVNYRQNPVKKDIMVDGLTSIEHVSGRVIDLTITLSGNEYKEFQINLAQDKEHQTSFVFNREKQIISVDRTYSGLTQDHNCQRSMKVDGNDEIRLQFILDTHSIELFVNGGEQVFSTEIVTPLAADGIQFLSDGRTRLQLEKYDLKFVN